MGIGLIKNAYRVPLLLRGGWPAMRQQFFGRRHWILSYPKCGRTWLRGLLGQVLIQRYSLTIDTPGDLIEIPRYRHRDLRVPRIHFTHDDNPHQHRADEQVRDKSRYARARVVLLVRDPRDVVVSNYYQESRRETHLGASFGFDGTLSEFIHHEIHGIESIVAYLNIWSEQTSTPENFMLLRYEDLHADPSRELRRLLAFVGVDNVSDNMIAQAIEWASFDHMKKLESTDALNNDRLRPTDMNDENSYKVRRGKVGGYRDEAPPAEIDYMNRVVADKLNPLYGYATSFPPPEN